jgi:hypothetical protein
MSPRCSFSAAVVILASLALASSLSAQPLADAALAPAELTDLNRAKFEKVYAAGRAVASAQYLGAVGVSPRKFQQLNLTFSKALSIVADTAMTKGEKALFGQFQIAALRFELAIAQRSGGGLSGWKARKTMREAMGLLDAANKVYRGKA